MKWEPAGKGGGAKPRDKKRGGCLAIIAAIVIIAIVGGIVSSCGGGEEPERFDWPTTGLAAMLPEPSVDTGSVSINSEDSFSADVEGYARSDYEGYAAQCQERGFTVDASEGGDSFEAYNAEGYHLRLSFYDSMEEMDIHLDAPVEMGEISWPTTGLAALIPAPPSTTGRIGVDSSSQLSASIGNMSAEQFSAYVDACSAAGFNVDYDRGDTTYSAHDASGNSLRLSYEGFNIVEISMYASDDPAESAEETPATEEPAPEAPATTGGAAGTSDFRATMDAYETFMNEYVDFMLAYSSDSSNVVSMALDYADMMARYSEFADQVDAIDENSLSADDLAYYMEVMGRVNARLLEIGQ